MPLQMSHRFHIVDVFAEALYAGNPLAVVCDAGDLDRETMQRIAREFGFSETTFVTSPASEAGTAVRIFTPAEELPFAGHPTLGTAWVIREHLLRGGADALTLVLGVGRVPVAFTPEPGGGELVWLTAPPVSLERRLAPAQIAPALGLADSEIRVDLPVTEVRAGVHQLLVPLTSLAAVRRARLDPAAFAPLRAQGFPDHVYLFARETEGADNQLHARMFFTAGGVREDPATGSATACLGAYLLAHGSYGERFALRIEQGLEMGRPSLLRLEVTGPAAGAKIRVGGRVLESARGELL
jgi:trans-2,3-dihydro-3-hydroxyanthranilate isomerase